MSRDGVLSGPRVHGAVRALWVAGCLVATMATFDPVTLALSLVFAVATSLVFRGAAPTLRAAGSAVPLLVFVAVLNPIVSPTGGTVLLSAGPVTLTLEGVAWGASMGAMVAATLVWAQTWPEILPADDVRDLLGGVAPTLALMVSMVFRLVPDLLRRARSFRDARDACSCAGEAGAAAAFGRGADQAGSMVVWALAESVERASSMASRGWGAGPRSRWRPTRWSLGDTAALVAVAAVVACGVVCALWLGSAWTPAPRVSGPWQAYCPVALLFATPCLGALGERLALGPGVSR